MHSSFPAVRAELPMNCRRRYTNRSFSEQALREINRIQHLWTSCRRQYGDAGSWLFGRFTIADAMFAPVALRFHSYAIVLDDISQAYVDSVLQHPGIVEWIDASKTETEFISEVEFD